ncbi:hypothetical protein BLEM_1102 [Bifidobacterium lemurum]|uniref:Uncharacterized protein n=1 Tax=Bifidobacterium lemurum TaxID=1603886 RepID=A0A261FUW9_9BIFI|nr:hypothetical protein [Bifidobacterium lemurum]OZG62556.1 hypothetical protein BLEM_1102 [Bifidobacterium lemurum]QOL33888.1 hypothetical protein BL8807_08980 [Bifidobacterium lemurum]
MGFAFDKGLVGGRVDPLDSVIPVDAMTYAGSIDVLAARVTGDMTVREIVALAYLAGRRDLASEVRDVSEGLSSAVRDSMEPDKFSLGLRVGAGIVGAVADRERAGMSMCLHPAGSEVAR